MSIFESRSQKKKAQRKKNRFQQELFNVLRLRREEAERVEDLEKSRKPKKGSEKKEAELWSAKTATIRNRLTDKKRHSKERWNRFAGTGDAGGRGL